MNIRELALIIFTVLAQMTVGMLLVQLVVRASAVKKLGAEKAAQLMTMPVYSMLPVMVLAMLASLLHLGKVTHVIGAVPNLGTSWMSREVVLAVIFTIGIALYTFLAWRKSAESQLVLVGWVTALLGIALVYAMGMTYMLPAQPAMNTFATPVNFIVTACLLGVLGFAAALMVSYSGMSNDVLVKELVSSTLQGLSMVVIVALGVEFLVLPVYMAYLSTQGAAALKSLSMMVGEFGFVMGLRLVLIFVGAGVMAAYLYRNASQSSAEKSLATYVYAAFVLVLLGELLGRFLFYATQYRIGV